VDHINITNVNIFNNTTTTSSTFKSQSHISSNEGTFRNMNIFHTTRHLTTNNKATMTMIDNVIFNNDILSWHSAIASILIFTGFKTNRIISNIKSIVVNQNIFTGFQIQS